MSEKETFSEKGGCCKLSLHSEVPIQSKITQNPFYNIQVAFQKGNYNMVSGKSWEYYMYLFFNICFYILKII